MSHMEEVEKRSAALYKAPRVSLDDIKNAISSKPYLTGADAYDAAGGFVGAVPADRDALSVLTICLIVMKNGFTIIGKSAPASPENFDAEYGKELAYEDAIKQLWPLMGFALKDRLASCTNVIG